MPTVEVRGIEFYYEEEGSGPETVVFAHSLLFNGRMFEAQVRALRDRYRCVAFDFRGHGESQVTPGGYHMDTLCDDAAGLIESLGLAPCHFLGFSMGGFVAIRLALRRPELLKSLILAGTSADPELKGNLPKYRVLNLVARRLGPGAVARHVMPIMFSQKFLRDPKRAKERKRWREVLVSNDRTAVTSAVSAVISREGLHGELGKIDLPALIIAGEHDVATPPEHSGRLNEGLAGSKLVMIPGAGHMTPVEEPEAVARALREFLDSLT